MSAYTFRTARTLIKKELIEHKIAFIYVPPILIGLALLAFFVFAWRNNDTLENMKGAMNPIGGLDLFNALYASSIFIWMGYLTLMLFFYFAGSFAADRKNNALLFWKSLPITDLEIMTTKTLAGLTIFPLVVFGWALVTALAHTVALNALTTVSPFFASLNTGLNIWTLLNLELSALVFVALTLLWQLPLFTFVGLLGTLLRNWAVPAFFLILIVVSSLEAIIYFTPEGFFVELVTSRAFETFNILNHMDNSGSEQGIRQILDSISAVQFVPDFLSRIDWAAMVLGWVAAAGLIYLASEIRRRQLAD